MTLLTRVIESLDTTYSRLAPSRAMRAAPTCLTVLRLALSTSCSLSIESALNGGLRG